jgi:acetylornithine/succinyldiaminopimelate/putrescine aminotransferase
MRYIANQKLQSLREHTVKADSCGLSDSDIDYFYNKDPLLRAVIDDALVQLPIIREEFPEISKLDEIEQVTELGRGLLHFYPVDGLTPYVPIAARGPWIVTVSGGIIYDTGGYGMIGHGHNPSCVLEVLAKPQIMANMMTPAYAQRRFLQRIKKRIGHLHSRQSCPYGRFLMMNSGSEGMAVALRITDAYAKKMTDPDGKRAGAEIKFMSFKGSFHGRAYRTARMSSSTIPKYREALASFRNHNEYLEIRVNDTQHLKEVYSACEANNIFIEALALEPVMGEGNPGVALDYDFYQSARELTKKHGTMLIIDSIQAGLRAHGVLSIVDYPDFKNCDPPDIEVFSKALNAGQYPLSLIAMQQWVADEYVVGTYGNTMTTAPRALDVASKVLEATTPELAKNISEKGKEFVEKLKNLQLELSGVITNVQGTGLLVAAELRSDITVKGATGIEQTMRRHGINVIKGGQNALRFTPWFMISSDEIDLMIRTLREVLGKFTNKTS